jgi:hypothetical protein
MIIREGTAIALSDGPYKQDLGAAAWILLGQDVQRRISGVSAVLGCVKDQLAYRSELVGILAVLMLVKELCNYHKEGSSFIHYYFFGMSHKWLSLSYL